MLIITFERRSSLVRSIQYTATAGISECWGYHDKDGILLIISDRWGCIMYEQGMPYEL